MKLAALFFSFLCSLSTTDCLYKPSLSMRRDLQTASGAVDCLLYQVDALYRPGSDPTNGKSEFWVCVEDTGERYHIERPDTYFDQAISGETRLRLSNALKSPGTAAEPPKLVIPSSIVPEFVPEKNGARRTLLSSMGDFLALVVRVSSRDMTPSRSAAEISEDVFSDSLNFATLMSDCSAGQATFAPATGIDVVGGVSEVYIDIDTDGMNCATVEVETIKAINAKFSSAFLATIHAMILILPFNEAYAYINGRVSVYRNENGSSPGILMHEVGHNMGLQHSGEYDSNGAFNQYNDWTCQMGNGAAFADKGTGVLANDDFGAFCFNGPKSWFLGWYSERHAEVSPVSSAWVGNLAGIDSYVNGDTAPNIDYVVVKLDVPFSSQDFYMMYNKKEGITKDVRENENAVVIWSAAINDVSSVSTSLYAGDVFSVINYGGTSGILRVKVCSLARTAEVIVYLDGQNIISCSPSSPTPQNTPQQTPWPTPRPAPGPTPGPASLEEEPGPVPTSPSRAACFSGRNSVIVRGRGSTMINQVNIGDEVLVGRGDFSRVYSFGHRDADSTNLYVKIVHNATQEQPLELTPKHIVFVSGRGVTAENVQVGDVLTGSTGESLVVLSISLVVSRGLYAPFTFSGDIVVNGVLASNYVNFLKKTIANPHSMNHAYLAPLRSWCRLDPMYCASESYDKGGVSNLYTPSMRLLASMNVWDGWSHFILSCLASPALILFQAVEWWRS